MQESFYFLFLFVSLYFIYSFVFEIEYCFWSMLGWFDCYFLVFRVVCMFYFLILKSLVYSASLGENFEFRMHLEHDAYAEKIAEYVKKEYIKKDSL